MDSIGESPKMKKMTELYGREVNGKKYLGENQKRFVIEFFDRKDEAKKQEYKPASKLVDRAQRECHSDGESELIVPDPDLFENVVRNSNRSSGHGSSVSEDSSSQSSDNSTDGEGANSSARTSSEVEASSSETAEVQGSEEGASEGGGTSNRKKLLVVLGAIVALAGIGGGVFGLSQLTEVTSRLPFLKKLSI